MQNKVASPDPKSWFVKQMNSSRFFLSDLLIQIMKRIEHQLRLLSVNEANGSLTNSPLFKYVINVGSEATWMTVILLMHENSFLSW